MQNRRRNESLLKARNSSACDCADYEEWLGSRDDCVGEWGVGLLVREIFAAGEEAQERATGLGDVVADRATQHRVATFERVDDGALRDGRLKVELDFAIDAREAAQVRREKDANHGSVWTSTESTAGRSRTMGDHVSPASAEAYTCPPVVPKYTPHLSSESTAMASRSTLT